MFGEFVMFSLCVFLYVLFCNKSFLRSFLKFLVAAGLSLKWLRGLLCKIVVDFCCWSKSVDFALALELIGCRREKKGERRGVCCPPVEPC